MKFDVVPLLESSDRGWRRDCPDVPKQRVINMLKRQNAELVNAWASITVKHFIADREITRPYAIDYSQQSAIDYSHVTKRLTTIAS